MSPRLVPCKFLLLLGRVKSTLSHWWAVGGREGAVSILHLHLLFLSASFGLFQGGKKGAALFRQGLFCLRRSCKSDVLFSSAHHIIIIIIFFFWKIWILLYSTCKGLGFSFVCVCLCHRLAGVSPQSPVGGFECDSLGGNCFTARLSLSHTHPPSVSALYWQNLNKRGRCRKQSLLTDQKLWCVASGRRRETQAMCTGDATRGFVFAGWQNEMSPRGAHRLRASKQQASPLPMIILAVYLAGSGQNCVGHTWEKKGFIVFVCLYLAVGSCENKCLSDNWTMMLTNISAQVVLDFSTKKRLFIFLCFDLFFFTFSFHPAIHLSINHPHVFYSCFLCTDDKVGACVSLKKHIINYRLFKIQAEKQSLYYSQFSQVDQVSLPSTRKKDGYFYFIASQHLWLPVVLTLTSLSIFTCAFF